MGVSATGQGIHMSAVRNGLLLATILLSLFYYLYGPPLTQMMRDAAHEQCNDLTGNTFRSYRLAWETTTYSSLDVPHWQCYEVGKPVSESTDLGWWVGLS